MQTKPHVISMLSSVPLFTAMVMESRGLTKEALERLKQCANLCETMLQRLEIMNRNIARPQYRRRSHVAHAGLDLLERDLLESDDYQQNSQNRNSESSVVQHPETVFQLNDVDLALIHNAIAVLFISDAMSMICPNMPQPDENMDNGARIVNVDLMAIVGMDKHGATASDTLTTRHCEQALSAALYHLERAKEVDEVKGLACFNTGVVQIMEGRLSDALFAFEHAVESNPEDPDFCNNFAVSLASASQVCVELEIS